MKKILVFTIICAIALCSTAHAKYKIWSATAVYGGATGALDKAISGVSIGPYDSAIVTNTSAAGVKAVYTYMATFTTAAEDIPYVIRPDDIAGGVTSWELVNVVVPTLYTQAIAATGAINGLSKHINLSSGTLETFVTAGVSSIYVSAVSAAARDPLSGVSVLMPSPPAAGYDISFIMENSTYEKGTTAYVTFDPSDTIATADTFIAGASKYVMSGTTDAQMIFLHSTGVSTWFVRTTGSPTVDAD